MIDPHGTVYDLTGPEDAPVVVLIHGLGLNRAVWQWLLPDLKNFRVPVLILSGGEPLLRPDIFDIAKRAKARPRETEVRAQGEQTLPNARSGRWRRTESKAEPREGKQGRWKRERQHKRQRKRSDGSACRG